MNSNRSGFGSGKIREAGTPSWCNREGRLTCGGFTGDYDSYSSKPTGPLGLVEDSERTLINSVSQVLAYHGARE